MNKYYVGVLRQDKNSNSFVDAPEVAEPIRIGSKYLNRALNGDKVLVKIKEGERFGFIQKIVERNKAVIIGQIQINKEFAFVKPWTSDYNKDFFIEKKDIGKAKDGDVVEIQIVDWFKKSKSPSAKVIKTLYHATSEQYLMHRLNLPTKFPEEVLNEVKEISPIRNYSDRIDLRHLNVFSIDPLGSKDLDDALSLENTEHGYRVGVHVADVTAWVKAGSKIDQEAYKRGTSIYLPNTCIPMLPSTLSYDLCSLLPKQDRLAVSVMINFDREWKMVDFYIFRSVINNRYQFTYEEAEEHRNNSESEYYSELNMLYLMGEKVRNHYFPDELELNLPEMKWEFDENGEPIKIKIKKRVATCELIQSWMLMANKLVTQKIEQLGIEPWIYRAHGSLTEEKLADLKIDLKQIDVVWDDSLDVSQNIRYLLTTDKSNLVSEILVRKFKSAFYTPERKGHFALGAFDYAHFTSPIRRYPDVLVHRILLNAIAGKQIFCGNIDADCKHLSIREKKADEVEKIAHQLNMLKFVKDVKYTMNGKIINFSKRGILVRTELMVEALIQAKHIDAQWNEQERRWVNVFNWKIGDTVNVKISSLDWSRREIFIKIS